MTSETVMICHYGLPPGHQIYPSKRPGSGVPSAEGSFASQAPAAFPAQRPVLAAVVAPALGEALGAGYERDLGVLATNMCGDVR